MFKKKNIIVFFLLAFLAFVVFKNSGSNYSTIVLSSSFIIISISVIKIFFNDYQPFSLNTIFYLFTLLFLGIAPALQFKKDIFFLGVNSKLDNDDFLHGNLVFIACIIVYEILYTIIYNAKFLYKRNQKKVLKKAEVFYNKKIILLISLLVLVFIFIYFSFNLEAIFNRKFLWYSKNDYSKPILSLVNVIRGLPLILFLFYKLNAKKNITLEVFLLFIVVICNFPIAIPRYKLAVIYFPIILIYLRPYINSNTFALSFITLFLSVFPYLHHFRYNNNIIPDRIVDFEMFTQKHFDTYQNSVNIMSNDIVTNGHQLLGTIFFFIPRNIWETKSMGSGHVLADKIEYEGFSNVAISYFAEGYINFGYLGILLFVLLLASINAFFDNYYWKVHTKKNYIEVIYLILIPFEFFILRGSLLASVANLIGFVVFIILSYYILKKTAKLES